MRPEFLTLQIHIRHNHRPSPLNTRPNLEQPPLKINSLAAIALLMDRTEVVIVC